MRGLAPAYFLTVSVSAGTTSAAVFYEGVLLLVWLVQSLLLGMLLPGVGMYVLLSLINHLSKEEMLDRMAELLKTVVNWGLKTMLGAVVGLQVVRNLVAPVTRYSETEYGRKGGRCASGDRECSQYGDGACADKCGAGTQLPGCRDPSGVCGGRCRAGDSLRTAVTCVSLSCGSGAACFR